MVHFYIGDGKGKTTAALGLALRAAGAKKRVYIGQFLKDEKSFCSECEALKKSKLSIKFARFTGQKHPMFLKTGGKFDKMALTLSIKKALMEIEEYMDKKKFDVFILDELLNAVRAKFCSASVVKKLIKKGKPFEVVLTGRNASGDLISLADYVSFIKKVKHPFDKKIVARKGIEY
jgi:cob(I)alamin adenosyltransferase